MALASNVGASVTASGAGALFGEDQARYLLAVADAAPILAAAKAAGVPAEMIGKAGGESLSGPGFDLPLAKLRTAHEGWMPAYMGA
jgi:phosphoribosylformylglycinamidine synthase